MQFRITAFAVTIAMAALVTTGCLNEGSSGPYSRPSSKTSVQETKNRYRAAMENMIAAMDPQNAVPADVAVRNANRNQLVSVAQRWDAGIAVAKSATPPSEAKAAHTKLVKAMEQLSDWNRKIAQAAPNKKRVSAIVKKAQTSTASKQYGQAIAELISLGYLPSENEEPFSEETPID